jgi:hypothetical protein
VDNQNYLVIHESCLDLLAKERAERDERTAPLVDDLSRVPKRAHKCSHGKDKCDACKRLWDAALKAEYERGFFAGQASVPRIDQTTKATLKLALELVALIDKWRGTP